MISNSPRQTLLLHQAQSALDAVLEALEGLTPESAARPIEGAGRAGLYTDGTVLGMLRHIITSKVVHTNEGFGDTSLPGDWDQVEKAVEGRCGDLQRAVDLLRQAHDEWITSWSGLTDAEMDVERPVHAGEENWPGWRIAYHVAQNDMYHAGQMAMVGGIAKR